MTFTKPLKSLTTMASAMLFANAVLAMSDTPDEPGVSLPAPNTTVRFIAIGDMGTGKEGQYQVSRAMEQVCAQQGCDFAIGLGDNIYESGVDSTEDEQWMTKFEQPYANLDFPFYMTLGNHDNSHFGGEGLDNFKGEVQVDYTYKADRFSDKWNMPARYYHFTAPLNADVPLVDFFSLDSNPLAAVSDFNHEYWQLPYKKKHSDWMDDAYSNSTAQWKVAFAHHPMYSNGKHGNAGIYDGVPLFGQVWKDFLKDHVCDRVDLIITGHDHDLQFIKPQDKCGKTQHIVSGAGGKTREFTDPDRNATYWQKDGTYGFFWLEMKDNQLTVQAWTVNGDTFTKEFERVQTK